MRHPGRRSGRQDPVHIGQHLPGVPLVRLEIESQGRLPLRFLTWFTFDGFRTGTVDLTWADPGRGPAALARAALGGSVLEL